MALDPADRLRDSPEDQIGVSVPSPLNARLDALVALANSAGESTSRKEVLAALILAAPDTGADIGELVRTYRTASVEDVVTEGGIQRGSFTA